MLATLVLVTQLAVPTTAQRAQPEKPCASNELLCQMNPLFCPGAYPEGLEPCWPEEAGKSPRVVAPRGRSATASPSASKAPSVPAPSASRPRAPERSRSLIDRIFSRSFSNED
jgi:hypothetical protein